MSQRAGITTRPRERKLDWLLECPTFHNWQLFGPFGTREQAEAWGALQRTCAKCGEGEASASPGAKWWGYRFED